MVAEARQEQPGGHSLDVAGFLQEKGPGHLDGGGLLCPQALPTVPFGLSKQKGVVEGQGPKHPWPTGLHELRPMCSSRTINPGLLQRRSSQSSCPLGLSPWGLRYPPFQDSAAMVPEPPLPPDPGLGDCS